MPFNSLRIIGYKLLGYSIGRKVKIGFNTRIVSNNCKIEDGVRIGKNNIFYVNRIIINSKTRIGSKNKFEGDALYSRSLENSNTIIIGNECLITTEHYFDASFGISIGDYTWIAGRGSSFFSHGATYKNSSIIIGEKCYIGSGCMFSTGLEIGAETLICMGSVVTKSIGKNCSVAGNPALVKKTNYKWYKNWWTPNGFNDVPNWRQ